MIHKEQSEKACKKLKKFCSLSEAGAGRLPQPAQQNQAYSDFPDIFLKVKKSICKAEKVLGKFGQKKS